MTEAEQQILVMCWAKKISLAGRAELDLLFHIPNGGSRSKREGSMFKAMGVKPGVPDLLLPIPSNCGKFNNLWIEMKTDGGNVSPEQQKWHRMLQNAGGNVHVAWDWKNAVEAICEHLGGVWPDVDMSAMQARMNGGCDA